MRQIILDTETTGLEPQQGHRIIEIGAIEMVNRRLTGNTFHRYLNPQREIDEAAIEVHGITNEQLQNEPLFIDIADELFAFLEGAELVIHNAPFDVGFLNNEYKLIGKSEKLINQYCEILDTLVLARQKHPGQKNNLDALCKRYEVNNSQRTLHGALLDSEILADVYLAMTAGQMTLLDEGHNDYFKQGGGEKKQQLEFAQTRVIQANDSELQLHQQWLDLLDQNGKALWRQLALVENE